MVRSGLRAVEPGAPDHPRLREQHPDGHSIQQVFYFLCDPDAVAGGSNRRGAALPAVLREASEARRTERSRSFCWVTDPGGPWPGVVVEWLRVGAGWHARTAYVVTDAHGGARVVVAVVESSRLEPSSPA